MNGLVQITPEAQELIAFAGTFLATATAVRITSPAEAQAAVDQTRAIKECAKALDETRKGYTTPLDDQKEAFMDAFRPARDTLTKAEQLLKGAIATWQAEQAKIQAAADAERRRLEALERERQAQEQAAAAQLVLEADAARAAGNYAAAEELEDQAAATQENAAPLPCPVMVAVEKPKGASGRTIWKCRVVDAALVPRDWCCPDQAALDALAAAKKGSGAPPAGCEWTSTTSVSIR